MRLFDGDEPMPGFAYAAAVSVTGCNDSGGGATGRAGHGLTNPKSENLLLMFDLIPP